jgi:hypothetical protein
MGWRRRRVRPQALSRFWAPLSPHDAMLDQFRYSNVIVPSSFSTTRW